MNDADKWRLNARDIAWGVFFFIFIMVTNVKLGDMLNRAEGLTLTEDILCSVFMLIYSIASINWLGSYLIRRRVREELDDTEGARSDRLDLLKLRMDMRYYSYMVGWVYFVCTGKAIYEKISERYALWLKARERKAQGRVVIQRPRRET